VRVDTFHEIVDHFKHRLLAARSGAFVAVTYRIRVLSGPAVKPDPQVNRQLVVGDQSKARWVAADSVSGCNTATVAFAADRKLSHFPGQALSSGTTVAVYLVPAPNARLTWIDRSTGAAVVLPAARRVGRAIT
jgi:hypothetical protein